MFVGLSVCLFVGLFACLLVCLFVCSFVCLAPKKKRGCVCNLRELKVGGAALFGTTPPLLLQFAPPSFLGLAYPGQATASLLSKVQSSTTDPHGPMSTPQKPL
jgi:hypothetical protein